MKLWVAVCGALLLALSLPAVAGSSEPCAPQPDCGLSGVLATAEALSWPADHELYTEVAKTIVGCYLSDSRAGFAPAVLLYGRLTAEEREGPVGREVLRIASGRFHEELGRLSNPGQARWLLDQMAASEVPGCWMREALISRWQELLPETIRSSFEVRGARITYLGSASKPLC